MCAPSLWQQVIARCTELRPNLAAYEKKRQLLWQGVKSFSYEMAQPDGAFYLFVKAPNGSAKAFSNLAKQLDVLVVPGDDFGCPEYFRLCCRISRDCIVRSLPLFEKLYKTAKKVR